MSTLDFLSTNLQIGDPAPYKPAKFGEVVQSALYSFGQRTGFEITPVLETAQDYSDRDNTLKQRFTSEELTSFTGTDDELKKEVINLDAQKGIPFAPNYTPEINNIKNQKLDQAIIKGRDQDPIRWQGIKTTAELQEEKRNRARSAKESYEEIASRASPTAAFIGSLIGGLGAAFTDPINIATLPFGATSSMGILKAVKTEALLNAAVEAAEVPLVASWQKELGYKYGIGDAAMDIATAGIAGGTLAGIIKGARPVIEALGRGFDASGRYIGSKSQPILQKIGDSEKLPSSVRDAAKYMSRVAHIDENNPIAGHSINERVENKTQAQNAVLHRQTLQDTQDAFKNYEQPIYDERINITEQKPILAYHGTTKDFDKFNFPSGELPFSKEGIGPHFGTEEQAKFVADAKSGKVKEFYLDIKNPIRLEDRNSWSHAGVLQQLKEKKVISEQEFDNLLLRKNNADVRQVLREKGYDGIIYDNKAEGKGDSYIPLSQEQIKIRQQLESQKESPNLQSLLSSQPGSDLIFRPNDALTSIQKDIEAVESLNTGDTFKADFERLLKDNPDLEIETEAGRLTLREIKEQITEDETILSAIKTCAIGKK